ncbi:MAG: beta-galactosidase [Sphingobacteriales bacterium]|nr:MAG: beta-galactosidase [Sphingobacteriales bacterium]
MKKNLLILTFILINAFFFASVNAQSNKVNTFALGDSVFLLNGKPFQMISGEMHYPRMPKENWRSVMRAAKAMGLNTIGTYIFWNLHEPKEGIYDFSGDNNVAEFVKIAQQEGLWVILRPSPYVCAEWEFGGYPYWLLNKKDLVVRSTEPQFIQAYTNYIKKVAQQLAPLQVNHGGNILMVQLENEYGFFGSDKNYLELNRKLFVDAGFDGLLYTCDSEFKVENGHLPGLLPAINGSDNPEKVKSVVQKYHNGKGPYYISEWYPAWFDNWGAKHHTLPYQKFLPKLDSVLTAGLSINMYMFYGGTTRGFMNGANVNNDIYEPETSSYDYDAPLDEAGNATEKFIQFRKVIQKHTTQKLPPIPAKRPTIAIKSITLNNFTSFDNLLPKAKFNVKPLTFEALNQAYGYVLYKTILTNTKSGWLKIKEVRDYATVYANGKRLGVLDRRLNQDSVYLASSTKKIILEILVENLGRINFGPQLLKNNKGITQNVMLNGTEILNWQMFSLPFTNIDFKAVKSSPQNTEKPILRKGVFKLTKTGDTYLDMRLWGKGCVWVNGHSLGRYWEIGPQQTLFIPKEWLKKGDNTITIFEMLKPNNRVLSSLSTPILDMVK